MTCFFNINSKKGYNFFVPFYARVAFFTLLYLGFGLGIYMWVVKI